jgi:type IV secretion system protein VirD4
MALSSTAGWWLANLLHHPMLGLAGGFLAAFSALMGWGCGKERLADGTIWSPEDYSPWTQLGVSPVIMAVMAVCGGIGSGLGALVGEAWNHQPIIGQTLGMIGGALCGWLAMMQEKELENFPKHHDDAHGRARPETLEGALDGKGIFVNPVNGLWLGQWTAWVQRRKWKKPVQQVLDLGFSKMASSIVIAPPGSGKFTAAICPTLLTNTTDNIVVLDPAGQACAVTARFRRSIGHRVVVINPFNELPGLLGESSRVNVLADLEVESPTFAQDIRAIATIIVPIMADDKNRFFTDSARDLVMSMIIHHRLTLGDKATLPGVNELLQQTPLELDKVFEAMRFSEVASVRHVGNRYHLQSERGENNSILGTAKMAMSFLADDAMERLFGAGNNFSFRDLKQPDKPTTVFIVWPALKANDYARAAEILIGSALNSLMTYPASPSTLFIVDEMQAALQQQGGAIARIRDGFTNGRKVGLRIMAVAQDWNQFLGMFPHEKDAYTLLNSAGMAQFFGTGAMDTTTQDLIIAQAGDKTIWKPTQNKPVVVAANGGAEFIGWEPSQSSATGVPLLDRLDLREMQGNDQQIAFLMGGAFPVIMPRSHYYKIDWLRKRADPDPYETSKTTPGKRQKS